MNEDLARHFDIAVIEWLIALVILIILAVVGAVVTRQSRRAFRELTVQSSDQVSKPESWHAKSAEAALESLITTPQGLSGEEITVRLSSYGPNRLLETTARGPLIRFFYQFHNVLIYVLIAASAVTVMLGHWTKRPTGNLPVEQHEHGIEGASGDRCRQTRGCAE